jgi:hypothetical protein
MFLALDQRRRPDEPTSWSRYIPHVVNLARDIPVKVLVARRNLERFDELTNEHGESSPETLLEYVAYDERNMVQSLTEDARIVVTDLPYVATWAENAETALLEIQSGRVQVRTNGDGDSSLTDRVLTAFHEETGGEQLVH